MSNSVYDYKYYIHGRQIAILQRQTNTLYDPYFQYDHYVWETPDSTQLNGIQIVCTKKPTAPTDETGSIDLSETLFLALADYVKSRLLEDAGDDGRSAKYLNRFYEKIEDHQSNLRGSQARIMPGDQSLR